MPASIMFGLVVYVIYAIANVGMEYRWEKLWQKNNALPDVSPQELRRAIKDDFMNDKWVDVFAYMHFFAVHLAYVCACWMVFDLMYSKHAYVINWVKSFLAAYL